MKISQQKLYWFGGWLYDFTKLVIVLVFVALVTHYFFYTIFIVKGESMEPNFHDGDIILIDRIQYRLHMPNYQEPIALYFPGEMEKKYIKRVIGLPNDTVEIKNGKIYVNKQIQTESYIKNTKTSPDMKVVLDEKEFFVLGDNRAVSSDSRIWGSLPQHYIIGRADQKIGNTHEWFYASTWVGGVKKIPRGIVNGFKNLIH